NPPPKRFGLVLVLGHVPMGGAWRRMVRKSSEERELPGKGVAAPAALGFGRWLFASAALEAALEGGHVHFEVPLQPGLDHEDLLPVLLLERANDPANRRRALATSGSKRLHRLRLGDHRLSPF